MSTGPAQAATQADLVARGAYLTAAADCQGCHTTPGGAAFAGGRAFALPMGTIYSPNITPDAETGIGGYSDADWVRMLHRGIGRGGRHLYPAMPYPSYTAMSRDDALAIRAYLMTLPAVRATAPANHMRFPFNHRVLMIGWNLLNNPDRRLKPDKQRPADWNRGRYLAETLGHCAQCHTPRTITQGLDDSAAYTGAVAQGWLAYNLTSDPVHGLASWTDAALEQYLATGAAPGHGPASGPMAEAVQYSLSHLTPSDRHDIVVYLRSLNARNAGPDAVREVKPKREADPLGARIFAQACAGCHLPSGGGRQSEWAALGGDHSLGDPDGRNLVAVLSQGSQIQTPQGLMFMHAFTGSYTDAELAAAANYAIGQFSGRDGAVSPQAIAAARARP